MFCVDILSKIRKENWKFETKEFINFENTFIQQTSGRQNLWKVQLGETENYVLFFKQEVTLEEIPTDRFLLQVFPKDTIFVRKCSGRKLQVTFPKGAVAHFKLPVGRGCGTAWAKWRGLQDKCGRLSVSQKPQYAVFKKHELGPDILRTLKEKEFTMPMFLTRTSQGVLEAGWLLWMKSNAPEESEDRAYEPVDVRASSSLDNKINKWLESARGDAPGGKRSISPQKGRRGGKKAVVKLSRVVQRFGEGVPDGCTFNLSLTTNYPADDRSNTVVINPMCRHVRLSPRKRNHRLNIFEYLCKERRASEAILEHHCALGKSGRPIVRSPQRNTVDPVAALLEATQSGPTVMYGKKPAASAPPYLKASHSGPLQHYEKLLAEFEKPALRAADVLASRTIPKKPIVDTAQTSVKALQPVTVRSLRKKLADSAKLSLEESPSNLVQNYSRNDADSENLLIQHSRSGQVRNPVDPNERFPEESSSVPLRSSLKNPRVSAKPVIEAPVPVVPSVWNPKKNLTDSNREPPKGTQLVPIRSPKRSQIPAYTRKTSREANSDSVEDFVRSLGATEGTAVQDESPSWESIDEDSRQVKNKMDTSSVSYPQRLALPPPDLTRSRFGSILRPFHYLLAPRKWTSKVVSSSRSFECMDPPSKKK